jgi:peptide deformylase
MLRITKYGEPILKTKGRQIEIFDEELVDLANEMLEAMDESNGIGLAAQQVDQAIMLCVVDVNPDDDELEYNYLLDGKKPPLDLIMPMALVNPIINHFSIEKETCDEGCLSFPEIRGDIERPVSIIVQYQDLDGQPHQLQCDGMLARCIQHEVDHLNGILFIDRMSPKMLSSIKGEIRRLKKETLQSLNT